MIPKLLKIKGLYSYQSEQTINFDNLTDASLFGIFGAVGSGKSSILEAITFALYGDTERLNKSGDDRTYNMMNLRSDELGIDFECIAGKNGNRYRFTVKGRRNSKNFKDVKTFERRGYKWHEKDWTPLTENETTESIIGLSYDNFRRTIIIPQGRFQEFIELKDSERSRMMKELFQLEKYDLSSKVSRLLSQNNIEISNIEGQLTSLGEITKEMILEQDQKCELIKTEIKNDQENLILQVQLEEKFSKQKLALETIKKLKEQLSLLEAQEPQMRQKADTLRVFESCVLHFKPLFEQKIRVSVKLTQDQKSFDQTALLLKKLTEDFSIAKVDQSKIQVAYQNREDLLKQAGELEKLLQIFELTAQIKKSSASFERGVMQLESKKEDIKVLKNQKEKIELDLNALKEALPDINEIAQLKSWYATMDGLIKQKDTTRDEAMLVVKEKENLESELLKGLTILSEKYHFEISKSDLNNDFEKTILRTRQGLDVKIAEYDIQLLEAQTKVKLQQFANELVDGKPCPLCGANHHPAMLHASDDLSDILKSIKNQKLDTQKRSEDLIAAQKPIDQLFQNVDNLEKQKMAIKLRWDAIKLAMEEQDQKFISSKFDKKDKQAFENYTKELVTLQKNVRENELLIKEIALKISESELFIHEKLEKPLQKLRDEILSKKNETEVLKRQLLNVNTDAYTSADVQKIEVLIKELNNTYSEIKRIYEQREKEIEQIEKQLNTLSGGQATLKTAINSNRTELYALQEQITFQLENQKFDAEEWVQEILEKNLHIETVRKQIVGFDLALNNVQRDLQHHESQNTGEKYDFQRHEETSQKKNQLTEKLNGNRKEEGRLDGLIKKLNEDFINRTRLLLQKEHLDIRQSHLNELAKLFRSSGFVDYASSIYLKNLIQAANARFHQMTHQQLHLELGEGNSFWVRDLLNGGHLRLLKTLSGGQKFQAALSLALALADHIHIRNESKHNFFFLDEGFGSLDKNALQTVFDTLKSLKKENRIVGIISHVEDLQQEIQTYLKIEESEEGSRIVASWS